MIELVGPAADSSSALPYAPSRRQRTRRRFRHTHSNTDRDAVVGVGPYRALCEAPCARPPHGHRHGDSRAAGERQRLCRRRVAASPDGRRIFVLADGKVRASSNAVTLKVITPFHSAGSGVGIVAAPDNTITRFREHVRISTTRRPVNPHRRRRHRPGHKPVTPFGQFFGFSPDAYLFRDVTRGAPCDSTSGLVGISRYTTERPATAAGRAAMREPSARGRDAYVTSLT